MKVKFIHSILDNDYAKEEIIEMKIIEGKNLSETISKVNMMLRIKCKLKYINKFCFKTCYNKKLSFYKALKEIYPIPFEEMFNEIQVFLLADGYGDVEYILSEKGEAYLNLYNLLTET